MQQICNQLIFMPQTAAQVKEFVQAMRLSRYRTNHNLGVEVTYLKCSVAGCPHYCRLLENLSHPIPPFEIETAPDCDHNHQVEVPCVRGLTVAQKEIIRLSIERGQGAPKKVG